ncbi:MAG: DUF5667 domain-containing protein [Candidatus Nanoarchaeia archaeon]|nr:DUF5667 domain-containing protein [Candidatus Nanoarchaeia archaeon]
MKKLLTILIAVLFLVLPITFAEELTNEQPTLISEQLVNESAIETQTSSDMTETESQDIIQTITASEGTNNTQVAITPDMSVRWGLKRISEKINLFFTLNKTKQAEKKLAFAEERLQEMKQMSEKKNFKALVKAQRAHATLIGELARDEEVLASEDLEAADKIEIELQKHIQVLEGVQAKLEAKGVNTQGVENALVNSRKALDKYNSLNETRKAKVAEKLINKAEKVSDKREERKSENNKINNSEKSNEVEKEDSETETEKQIEIATNETNE